MVARQPFFFFFSILSDKHQKLRMSCGKFEFSMGKIFFISDTFIKLRFNTHRWLLHICGAEATKWPLIYSTLSLKKITKYYRLNMTHGGGNS